MTWLSGPISRLTAGRVGHQRRSGPATSGVCAVVLPGRRQSLPLRADARRGPPVPSGQGASRWLLPGRQRGLSAAALARVRGGRIKVIVAWRRARRLGRWCRRHQPPPGDAGQVPRCPGLPPSRIRRWCAHRVPVDARDRVRAGCDTWPGTRRPPGSPLPGHRAVGMMPAQPPPAPSPPWPGSDGAAPGIPGAVGTAWRDWRWRAADASCRRPLVPTGPPGPARIFSNHIILAGAPLRNRTVDLLLTISTAPFTVRTSRTDDTALSTDSTR
jgi:hypothetical protein